MLFPAGWTALEVRFHPREHTLRLRLFELEVDVTVKQCEALIARHFWPARAQQPSEQLGRRLTSVWSHHS